MRRRSKKTPEKESDSDEIIRRRVPHRMPTKIARQTQTEFDPTLDTKKWSEAFHEAVAILGEAIPYPSVYIKTADEERAALLEMCRRVAALALNPRASEEYLALERKLTVYEEKIDLLNGRCQEMTDKVQAALFANRRPKKEKSPLSKQLDRLEIMLNEQMNEERKLLADVKSSPKYQKSVETTELSIVVPAEKKLRKRKKSGTGDDVAFEKVTGSLTGTPG
jgi:hypothetical protein